MKYFYLVLSILFILFAVLQYNDPDPFIWGPYYLGIAAICFLEYRSHRYNWLLWLSFVLTLGWMISYIPDVITYFKGGMPNIANEMKASTPYIENMREFGGLLICLATILSILIRKQLIIK